jgi:hypothetical protein
MFVNTLCWNESNAKSLLKVEALEGDNAGFIATHTSIKNFEAKSSKIFLKENNEEQLLKSLSSPDLHHSFTIIEGNPGSGKSHLIRWLAVNWSNHNDKVLLIQRDDSSLEGTLKQVRDKLKEYSHLLADIGNVKKTSIKGRAMDFQSRLGNSLEANYFEEKLDDAAWCEKHKLYKLINNPVVIEKWSAPKEILYILDGKDGKRDAEYGEFKLKHLVELYHISRDLKGIGQQPIFFMQVVLDKEIKLIKSLLDEGKSDEEIKENYKDQLPNSLSFLNALRKRLNFAIQDMLGITHNGLRELFRRIRQELKKENKRLVLLIEDITNFDGVDNQLVDVLINQSETRNDICDLISVVGITPSYYDKINQAENIVDRVTLHIKLVSESADSEIQSYNLKTEKDRIEFVAKYLQAIRAEKDELQNWFENRQEGKSIPNKCELCSQKDECHAAFGYVKVEDNDIGLYPLTNVSVNNFFNALTDPDGKNINKTPRGVLQGILAPILINSDDLKESKFPSYKLEEHKWLKPSSLNSYLEDQVKSQIAEQDQERAAMLLKWWSRDNSDNNIFSKIPKGIFKAFDINITVDIEENEIDITNDNEETILSSPVNQETQPINKIEAEKEPLTDEVLQYNVSVETENLSIDIQEKPKPLNTKKSEGAKITVKVENETGVFPSPLTETDLNKRIEDLEKWLKKGDINEPEYWGKVLFSIAKNQVPWKNIGVNTWYQSTLFTDDSIRLETKGKTNIRTLFLPKQKWVKNGLESYLKLRSPKLSYSKEELDHVRDKFSRFLRKFSSEIKARVSQAIPKLEDGQDWNPVQTTCQVLLLREWLRGSIDPLLTPGQQWEKVLENELEDISNSNFRVPSWSETVQKIGAVTYKEFRLFLRQAVDLPQSQWRAKTGDKEEYSFVDTSEVGVAILKFLKDFKLSPLPPENAKFFEKINDLRILYENTKKMFNSYDKVPNLEKKSIIEQAEDIRKELEGISLSAYFKKANTILSNFEMNPESSIPPGVLTDISKVLSNLTSKELINFSSTENLRLDEINDFLWDIEDDKEKIESFDKLKTISWAINRVPRKDLSVIKSSFDEINKNLIRLSEWSLNFIETNKGSTTFGLENIHEIGEKIKVTAKEFIFD